METSFGPRTRVTMRIAGLFLLGGPLVGAGTGSTLTSVGLVLGAIVGLALGLLSAVISAIAVAVAVGPEWRHGRLSEQRTRRALVRPPLIVNVTTGVLVIAVIAVGAPSALPWAALIAGIGLIVGTPLIALILYASASFVLRPVLPRSTHRPKGALVVLAWTAPVLLASVALPAWSIAAA